MLLKITNWSWHCSCHWSIGCGQLFNWPYPQVDGGPSCDYLLCQHICITVDSRYVGLIEWLIMLTTHQQWLYLNASVHCAQHLMAARLLSTKPSMLRFIIYSLLNPKNFLSLSVIAPFCWLLTLMHWVLVQLKIDKAGVPPWLMFLLLLNTLYGQ